MSKSTDELIVGKGRFESFSDGIFAVAITLLALEVRLPQGVGLETPASGQFRALAIIWPQYLVYAATFATIGIMWLNHHALLDKAHKITHRVIVANLVLLGLICFLPFATYVIEQLGVTRPAVVFYGLVNVAIGYGYLFLQRAVLRAHGTSAPFTPWNFVGLSAYPLATIAALFIPILGVIIIALVAIFYAMPSSVDSSRRPLEEQARGYTSGDA
jgi:uncharacterized membrane protein